jgi:hypothetical protein
LRVKAPLETDELTPGAALWRGVTGGDLLRTLHVGLKVRRNNLRVTGVRKAIRYA